MHHIAELFGDRIALELQIHLALPVGRRSGQDHLAGQVGHLRAAFQIIRGKVIVQRQILGVVIVGHLRVAADGEQGIATDEDAQVEIVIGPAVPFSAGQDLPIEQIFPGSLGQIEIGDPLLIEDGRHQQTVPEHVLHVQIAAGRILREGEGHRTHHGRAVLMRLHRHAEDVRHQRIFQLAEPAEDIHRLLVKDPGNAVGVRAVQPRMGREDAELHPALVQIGRRRALKAGDVMGPEGKAAHGKGQAGAQGLCHRRIAGAAVTAPVDGELLAAGGSTARKEHRIAYAALLLDRLKDQLVVEIGVIIVHGLGIAAIVVFDIRGDALAEIGLDGIHTLAQQITDLVRVPGAGLRIGHIEDRQTRLPVVHLLDAASVRALQEVSVGQPVAEEIIVLSDIGVHPAADLEPFLMVPRQHPLHIGEYRVIPLKVAPVQGFHPVAVKMEHPHGNLPILHSGDELAGGLLIIFGLEAGREPETEAPGGGQSRAPGQRGVIVHQLRGGRAVDQVIADLLPGDGHSDIFHLLRADLEGNRAGMIRKNGIMLAGHIERNILVADLGGGTAVLVPHGDGLAVLYKRGKTLAEAVDRLARLERELRYHVRLILHRQIVGAGTVGHGALLGAHVGKVAKTRGSKEPAARLKAIVKITSPHPDRKIAGRHNRLFVRDLHGDGIRIPVQIIAGFPVVVALIMRCGDSDVIMPGRDKFHHQCRQIQRVGAGTDRALGSDDAHPVRDLLHRVGL